jgi:hypothetical protein
MSFEITAVEGTEADGLLQHALVNGLVIDVRQSAFMITGFRSACDLRSYAFEQVLQFQQFPPKSRSRADGNNRWALGH